VRLVVVVVVVVRRAVQLTLVTARRVVAQLMRVQTHNNRVRALRTLFKVMQAAQVHHL
jgi:hypothetical protein